MSDPIDDAIRQVVAALANTAPDPVPYGQMQQRAEAVATAGGPARGRWLAAAAAGLLVAGGVAALAVGTRGSGRSTAEVTVPPAPAATSPVTAQVVSVASTGPSETVTPSTARGPTSAAATTTSPSTAPAIPDLFPEPGEPEVWRSAAIAPSGSIDAALGDMVTRAADGDLWLHPGAFDPPQYGRAPGEPVRLLDMPDPRAPVTEGEGPNVASSVGGFINGALIYAECCEPVSGNAFAVSEPDGLRTNFAVGTRTAADDTGRRWAVVDPRGVALYDFTTGRVVGRSTEDDADGRLEQLHAVTWSPDYSEVWAIGTVGSDEQSVDVLFRFHADASLTEIERRELTSSQPGTLAGLDVAGRLSDGTIVVAEYAAAGTTVRLLGPGAVELDEQPPWTWPADAESLSVSPDGSTLAFVVGETAFLAREGEEPIEWGNEVSALWFVTTPAMPIGTESCEVGGELLSDYLPQPFADLDGDGVSERLTIEFDGPALWIQPCGTPSNLPRIDLAAASAGRDYVPIDVEGDGQTEIWISGTFHGSTPDLPCVALARFDGTTLVPFTKNRCIGDVGFGCVEIDGAIQPVFYERDGLTLTATLDDGRVLGTRTYESEEHFQELFDLAC